MPTSFEDALQDQLEATPDLKRRGKRILRILKSELSAKRDRQIMAMRANVLVRMDVDDVYDWARVDWKKWLPIVLKLLLALLPLLVPVRNNQ